MAISSDKSKKEQSEKPEPPNMADIQVGDFIVGRYKSSRWANWLPWENWHHSAIVSNINPLKVIEAIGPNEAGQAEGPREVLFEESAGWLKNDNLIAMKWLRPKFPDPIREIDKWTVPRRKRKILTEKEARQRAINYAKNQLGEDYSIAASKWNEDKWYCSLLIYKSFSRTVTDMYLEDYTLPHDLRAGVKVTPEDLLDSPHSEVYFTWEHKN